MLDDFSLSIRDFAYLIMLCLTGFYYYHRISKNKLEKQELKKRLEAVERSETEAISGYKHMIDAKMEGERQFSENLSCVVTSFKKTIEMLTQATNNEIKVIANNLQKLETKSNTAEREISELKNSCVANSKRIDDILLNKKIN